MEFKKEKITPDRLDALLNELITVDNVDTLNIIETSPNIQYGECPITAALLKLIPSNDTSPLVFPYTIANLGSHCKNGVDTYDLPSVLLRTIQKGLLVRPKESDKTFEDDVSHTRTTLQLHGVKTIVVKGLENDCTPMRDNYWSNILEIQETCRLLGFNLLILCDFEYGKELRMCASNHLGYKNTTALKPVFHISDHEDSYTDYENMVKSFVGLNMINDDFIKQLYNYTQGNGAQSKQVIDNIISMSSQAYTVVDDQFYDPYVEFNNEAMDKYLAV